MTAEPIFVNCCHCRECQKISGSAFAINALIEANRLTIVTGEENLAAEEGTARCAACNTLLWGEHPDFGRTKFLRVGTLDEGEKIAPSAHFFTRSKHPWVTIPDGVPAFEALPGKGDPPLLGAESAKRLEAARA